MSFSMEIKDEVTRLDSTKTELISELSAIVRNSADVEPYIKINVENNAAARRIFKLFKNVYDVIPMVTVRKRYNFSKNLDYILAVKNKCQLILEDLSIMDNNGDYLKVPHEYIISDDDSMRAYLRGLFISCGSVNDPKTSRYHLEFLVDSLEYAKFIDDILNNYSLNSKVIRRERNYMIYIKEAEKISDFLRIIKAYNAVMYYEDIRIYRDHKNMTNRLNNCEQANMDKVFFTASKQIKDIEVLKKYDIIDTLDDKLKEVIEYRVKYPESSLSELADIMSEELGSEISKSGLNHRFRKIREIVNRLEKKE
jgi:hypothetical protein